ncbi:MAG: sialidase family protein [Candidatus Acidiferrales bacterium]|jgi:hypothetical protein
MKFWNFIVLISVLVGAAFMLTSCSHTKRTTLENLREIPPPAAPDSAQVNLNVGPDGTTLLSWIEYNDKDIPELKFSTKKGEAWSPAQSIVKGDDLIVNYADFPSLLSLGGGLVAAHWMASPPGSEGYSVRVAFSRDGGQTWSKPVVPHRDHSDTEHGFMSMTPSPDGGVAATWLDSRKLAGGGSDNVAMMYTTIGTDGTLGPETTISSRVCDCCQPNSVRTSSGILTTYRQRTDKEIRDIAVVRFDGTKWSEPKTVFDDNWHIDACPINGPAIAAHENQVAVVWFTGANDKPKVELAFSSDGGGSFAPPVQVDEGNTIGRVGIAMLDSGSAVVTWLERGAKGGELKARLIDKNGTRNPPIVIGSTNAGSSSGFPRIERSGNTIMIAWTDTNTERIRVSELDIKN